MSKKVGLAKHHVVKYHKMLEAGIALKDIASRLHTTVDVLNRFTPNKVAKVKKKQQAAEKDIIIARKENETKASILAETAAKLIHADPLSRAQTAKVSPL